MRCSLTLSALEPDDCCPVCTTPAKEHAGYRESWQPARTVPARLQSLHAVLIRLDHAGYADEANDTLAKFVANLESIAKCAE